MQEEARVQREFDDIVPVLDKYGVAIGVQNHCGFQVNNAMGILHLIETYDSRNICAVLDQAHCRLNGEPPEFAIDIAWKYLRVMEECLLAANQRARRRIGQHGGTTGPPDDMAWAIGREALPN